MFEFDDKNLSDLIAGVYAGSITKYDLPEDLYYAISDYLKKGLYKGWGTSLSELEIGTSDFELLNDLRENIYMFSAAKTYQQVKDMTEAIIGDDGKIIPFDEFEDAATEIFGLYNDTWLRTEYDTAIGQAQNANRWNGIEEQKDVLPYLKYSAIEDENTSEICAPLNDITLPVDDPFWDEFMPLNHFNCRCTVEQIAEGEQEITPSDEVEEKSEKADGEMQDLFKMNPGKDRVIFSDEHPYFDVEKGDKGFARENFGLPIPKN